MSSPSTRQLAAGATVHVPAPPVHNAQGARCRVLAYDVCDKRRLARVYRHLEPWRTDAQYSVVETLLSAADRDALLADLADLMNPAEDKLALWLPFEGRRLTLAGPTVDAQPQWPACGHWLFSYDVTEPARLRAVQRVLAARTQALQRSVYWLRGPARQARALAAEALGCLDAAADRLWVYPLRSASDLWFVVGAPAPVLPVASLDGWTRAGLDPMGNALDATTQP